VKYYLKYSGKEEQEVTRDEYMAASKSDLFGMIPHNIIPALFMNKDCNGHLDPRSMHECLLREGLNARPGATPGTTEAIIGEEMSKLC
jgi:hypothetical protein